MGQDDQHHRVRERQKCTNQLSVATQIVADELRLKCAMLNLLRNATGYTPKTCEVSVSVTDRDEAGVIVSVKDSGFGIP